MQINHICDIITCTLTLLICTSPSFFAFSLGSKRVFAKSYYCVTQVLSGPAVVVQTSRWCVGLDWVQCVRLIDGLRNVDKVVTSLSFSFCTSKPPSVLMCIWSNHDTSSSWTDSQPANTCMVTAALLGTNNWSQIVARQQPESNQTTAR